MIENNKENQYLITNIIEGIQKNKGVDIKILDLSETDNTECKYFIICHGNSNRHTESIANHILEYVESKTTEKAYRIDGFKNSEWIIIDYIDIMVHIFQEPHRKLYNLEELWGDAKITEIRSEN